MLDPITRYLKRLIDRPADADAGEPAATPPVVEPPAGGLHVARRFPDADLDDEAVKVVRRLTGAGHEAFLVGGCVRDLLFGVRPKDYDVVTSAHPPEIRKLFRNCRIIGRRFRLAHIYFRDKIIEVATFRTEARGSGNGDADDGGGASGIIIRDDNAFGTAEEDARRRDFTVNALFYDVDEGQIIDYVGGVADAERRLVRMIGDPDVRLREDPIRMLRAIRLASRLGCEIEPRTLAAIDAHRSEILDAAAPRVGDELVRMFRGGAMAPAFEMMLTTGVLGVILPELDTHLRKAGRSASSELQAMRIALSVADRRAQEGHAPSPAVLFSLLLSPILLDGLGRGEVRDPGRRLADRLRPIAQRLSISKRDSEKIRLVLLAQDKLVPRRQRRRSGGSIVRRGYFPEALQLFELMTDATGDLRDEARRWKERLDELYPDGMPEPKRRRTPRSRRRREHGEKGARTG